MCNQVCHVAIHTGVADDQVLKDDSTIFALSSNIACHSYSTLKNSPVCRS